MKLKPHTIFDVVRPDEVAECWNDIYSVPGLYKALWNCVPEYKAPKPEDSEEPCYGMDCVADFWNTFSVKHKRALNDAAEKNN